MSTEEDRKSMDDVLASIRRIVRSEKEPEAQDEVDRASADGDPVEEATSGATAAMTSAPTVDPATPVSDEASQSEAPEASVPPSLEREPTLIPPAAMAGTAAAVASTAASEQDAGGSAGSETVDSPLALTSEMRLDEELANDSSTLSQAMDAAASDAPSMPNAPLPDAGLAVGSVAAAASSALGGDAEALKDMVRTVIREELTSSDTAGEAIRSIIRDELMTGEIGQNISQNVLALIQAEVSKATGQ